MPDWPKRGLVHSRSAWASCAMRSMVASMPIISPNKVKATVTDKKVIPAWIGLRVKRRPHQRKIFHEMSIPWGRAGAGEDNNSMWEDGQTGRLVTGSARLLLSPKAPFEAQLHRPWRAGGRCVLRSRGGWRTVLTRLHAADFDDEHMRRGGIGVGGGVIDFRGAYVVMARSASRPATAAVQERAAPCRGRPRIRGSG